MKLEVKHLDFQNNGFVKLSRSPFFEFHKAKLKNCSLKFYMEEPCLIYKDVTFGLDQIKPYLRPISDFNKEIEHNGEKFVPKSKFIGNPLDYRILENSYTVVQQLLEWHFDVFGLIDHGLAIDINTLKK